MYKIVIFYHLQNSLDSLQSGKCSYSCINTKDHYFWKPYQKLYCLLWSNCNYI